MSLHATDAFEYLLHGVRSERVPVELWVESDALGVLLRFGVLYSDGSRERVGEFEPAELRDVESVRAHMTAAYAAAGIDVAAIDRAKSAGASQADFRRHFAADPRFGQHIPGSGFYRRQTRAETPGAAFYSSTRGGGKSWHSETWGDWADQRVDPERSKAVQRCRVFKDMIGRASTNEGERANARDALARLMARHSIAEAEL